MTMRHLLVTGMLCLAFASTASARDGDPRQTDATPGRLLTTARHGATLMDRLDALRQLGSIRDRQSLQQWRVVESLAEFAEDAHPRTLVRRCSCCHWSPSSCRCRGSSTYNFR